MADIKKGDTVRQVVPVIEGIVTGFQVDQETGDRLLQVEYPDADGDLAIRYFKDSEVALVEV
jgi:hypothetical protein